MPAPLDARERAQLCARFDDLGPDAPTLCEGWTTADLAAHLVVRERNPLAGPGIVLGDRIAALGRLTEHAQAREKAKGYARVVERVRTGPPLGPFAVPQLRETVNLIEYVVHHEDVRRANGMAPRDGIDDVQDAVWRLLRRGARLLLRGVPSGTGVELARPGGDVIRARAGSRTAVLTGEPIEVLLWIEGRKAASRAEVGGDPEAVAALQAASLGI
jgi:uncharacterized protein (TIGR03085 family)